MNYTANGQSIASMFRRILVSCALTAAVAGLPVLVRAQAPAEPPPPPPDTSAPAPAPSSTQAPSASPQQTQQQTDDSTDKKAAKKSKKDKDKDSSADSQSSNASDAPKDAPPIPQQENPKVKAGSEADVNAIGNRDVGKGVNFYSLEKEIALGKGLAQEVERSSKLVDDPVVGEYVNRVGQNLVRNSDAKVPFTIKVIDSDQINAFALPGGFFYVNSGLILAADSEAEVAGVMAHEIAHVAARHGTRNATKGELAQLATIPLMMLGPGGWAGYGLYEGLNVAIPLGFLKFSRDDEREADYLGLQYMYRAGYDPNAFVTFFEKVEAEEKREPGKVPVVFSTHPPTPDRVQNIQKEIGEILPARDQYIVTTSEFDTVKARLRRIENRNKLQDTKNTKDKPTLRTRTEQQKTDGGGQQPSSSGDPNDDPDRPTLHKRPDDPNDQ